MPSIGAVTELIVLQRIDRAFKSNFDPETRKDAYRFLNLASRGGGNGYKFAFTITLVIFVLGFLVFLSGPTKADTFVFPTSLLAGICLTAWQWEKRKKARKELTALVASNPAYWNPIANKVKRIVLVAGRFEDGLPPTQATKIVH